MAIEVSKNQNERVRRALEALRSVSDFAAVSGLSVTVSEELSRTIPEPDSTAWTEDFHRWLIERCQYNMRWFTSMEALHRDFADWLVSRREAPPKEIAFEALLREAGFLFADGMVSALTLKRDFESYIGGRA